jgi:hypothetical protein
MAILGAFLCISASLSAGTVTLTWDPTVTYTDGTALTDLMRYRLYSGTECGVYTEQTEVTNSTTLTIFTLQPGCSNYFAVTAVNSAGVESAFSEEVAIYVPPSILADSPDISVTENASATFTVRLDAPPTNVTTVGVRRLSGGNPYLGAIAGTVLVFSPANWASPQTVTLTALFDPTKTNRSAFFELYGADLYPATIRVTAVGSSPGALSIEDGIDADGNEIPDVWEIIHLGGVGIQGAVADDDSDRDGLSNIQEYVAGTDPFDPGSRPFIDIRTLAGRAEISFHAREAMGSGYLGKNRFYTLEQSYDPNGEEWEPVSTATEILAYNQTVCYSEADMALRGCFYRFTARLQ